MELEISGKVANADVVCTMCLICGEPIPLTVYDHGPKICDKCKKAFLSIKDHYLEKWEKEGLRRQK